MFHSVRARLTLWYTAILALILIAFSGMSYIVLARQIRSAGDESLAATEREFAAAFANDPGGAGRPNLLLDYRYSDRDIMVFAPNGQLVAATASRMGAPERRELVSRVRRGLNGFATIAGGAENDGIRVFASPIDVVGMRYIVVVAQDLDEQADRLALVARALLFGIPLALVIAAAGGYVMARKSLAPVTSMSAKALQIGAETLTERIEVENERDELGFLATTLNELLERLHRTFESQRGFMAEASHELRTPLSIIQGEADVALSRETRTANEYRDALSVIQTAARKLTRVVESLFLLARSDAGRYPIAQSRFYLDELVSDSARAMRTVAAAREVELTCNATTELLMTGDEALLHRMLLNLIDNALKFTPPGGRVAIDLRADGDSYLIRVSDSGIGIPEADQARVFERFYRGGRTRTSRPTSSSVSTGAGLGLPIARWIAEVHKGTLDLERSDANGSTFVVKLPRGDEADTPESEARVLVQPHRA